MIEVTSHTIVKNGMPFIGLVLKQAEPYMTKMIIELSEKSSDGTKRIIDEFKEKFPDKVSVYIERETTSLGMTGVRNRMIEKTETEWMMIIDDDDYWCHDDLEEVLKFIEKNGDEYDCFAISPYQMLSFKRYDSSWLHKKYFGKFLKNQKGAHYKGSFPREMPYLNDEMLYWKCSLKVKTIPQFYFYHLALMKDNSFRNNRHSFKYKIGVVKEFK